MVCLSKLLQGHTPHSDVARLSLPLGATGLIPAPSLVCEDHKASLVENQPTLSTRSFVEAASNEMPNVNTSVDMNTDPCEDVENQSYERLDGSNADGNNYSKISLA